MAHKAEDKSIKLPNLAASPMDINRLVRELDAINEALLQLKLRKSGSDVKLPKTTLLMDSLLKLNDLNLLHATDRTVLLDYLKTVKEQAPVIHMSFSADPPPLFVDKLMAWLRQQIHPELLLTIGLEPTIGAGCLVRTTNQYFDLSLKQDFTNRKELLVSKLVPASMGSKAIAASPEAGV